MTTTSTTTLATPLIRAGNVAFEASSVESSADVDEPCRLIGGASGTRAKALGAGYTMLVDSESALAPFASRPHRGELTALDATTIRSRYTEVERFDDLRRPLDPGELFANPAVGSVLGRPAGHMTPITSTNLPTRSSDV